MNMHCRLTVAMSLCAAVALPGLSSGALIDRGAGLIYDDDLNITWLADAKYGAGSIYDDISSDGQDDNSITRTDGLMTWYSAMDWAANLSYYDSVRSVTYDDWRLPTTLVSDPSCSNQSNGYGEGYGCAGSELGHMFYNELGGVADQSIGTTHDADYNLFTNLLFTDFQNSFYSATGEPNDGLRFTFSYSTGFQYATTNEDYARGAWAVRDGDVYAASTVPIPAAAGLFGSGLIGLMGAARKKPA